MINRHQSIVGVGLGLVRVGGGDVDDALTGIDFTLRDDVRGGVVPSFTDIEFTVSSCFTGGQCRGADKGVCHCHTSQGLVAGVLYRNVVGDDVACCIGIAAIHSGILDDVE